MSRRVATENSSTSHTGTLEPTVSTVYVCNLLPITIDSIHHCPYHGDNAVVSASNSVFVEGKRLVREGDSTACGATITEGCLSVYCGD